MLSKTLPLATCAFNIALLFTMSLAPVWAMDIKIAVASNFIQPLKEVITKFEQQTDHKVIISPGSTGKHYTQILNGAPFDIFFAADRKRPALLEQQGRIKPEDRFTYALGHIVLWSSKENFVDSNGSVLASGNFQYLAIANPKLAPYGKAAQQTLQALGIWDSLRYKIVRGENISQTFQFIKSANAELGFIANSQINSANAGSYWEVPTSFYQPIEQQAALLNDNSATRAFINFLQGQEAKIIIQKYGYDTP